jgi:hypothetical protein
MSPSWKWLAAYLMAKCTGCMSSYKKFVKPGTPALQSTRVLDQLRERIRYMHYSLSTEQVYVYWVRFFTRWRAD